MRKSSKWDRFEFPAKTIFANNSKIIDWRAIYNVFFCSKKEKRPKDTKKYKVVIGNHKYITEFKI